MVNGRLTKCYMESRLLKIKSGIDTKQWYPNWDDKERWAAQQALNCALEVLQEYEYQGLPILIVKFLDKILYFLYNYVTFLNNLMTQVTESGGRQNIYSIEPRPYLDESYEGYGKNAEKTNGRWAMLGFVALVGAYVTTGQIIPGIFQDEVHLTIHNH